MFKSVRIQNFRQFKDLKLDNLAQINLITGANNTGKTSLLEAIWLYQAGPVSPGVVIDMARIRGIDPVALDGAAAWGWIFREHQDPDGIAIDVTDFDERSHSLRVGASSSLRTNYPDRSGNGRPGSEEVVSTANVSARSLRLDYLEPTGRVHDAYLDVIGRDAIPHAATGVDERRWYFLAHRPGEPEQEAKDLDRLVLQGHESEIVAAYQLIDGRVSGVRSLDPGTGHRIYVQMSAGKLLPLSVMGDGLYRVGKIAMAIVRASGGVALIDEIDDGFHYRALPDVWRSVMSLARRHAVQIFATTHSYECLQAALVASDGDEDRLALLRLSRRDDEIRATRVGYEGMKAAAEFALELR